MEECDKEVLFLVQLPAHSYPVVNVLKRRMLSVPSHPKSSRSDRCCLKQLTFVKIFLYLSTTNLILVWGPGESAIAAAAASALDIGTVPATPKIAASDNSVLGIRQAIRFVRRGFLLIFYRAS